MPLLQGRGYRPRGSGVRDTANKFGWAIWSRMQWVLPSSFLEYKTYFFLESSLRSEVLRHCPLRKLPDLPADPGLKAFMVTKDYEDHVGLIG